MNKHLLSTTFLSLALVTSAAAAVVGFQNPILRGGFPDPSICRVDQDYYLVNSSFEYFPGLPVHHSRDLVNWTLIGHGLHREEQASGVVNLVDVQSDGGIHAPSIRCRDGMFYIITTNVYSPPAAGAETQFVNFVLTASDPAGPWSDPKVIEGAPGIDPDLFFDDDGRAWYVGTHSPEKPNFPGEGEIWLQELDTERWSLKGERYLLWRGACGGVWAEGPHLYKRDGRYYLLVAEGGTHFNHAVTVAVADQVTGPYESNPRNPILTSRHLSYDYWVNSTGHGDLIELADGRWYMVLLGIRNELERASNMGRETHLVPVQWEREPFEWKSIKLEWPVAAGNSGRVERDNPPVFPDGAQRHSRLWADDFDSPRLGLPWNFRRVPPSGTVSLSARPGYLRLAAGSPIAPRGRASLLGFRQTESVFEYRVRMDFEPGQAEAEAGLSLFQKDDNYLTLTIVGGEGAARLRLTVAERGKPPVRVKEIELPGYSGGVFLELASDGREYRLSYALDAAMRPEAFARLPGHLFLSKGYTGAYLGVYAAGAAAEQAQYADFDWVRYSAGSGQ
ncbi:MAG: glycoside hydrolase family 43 protein [Steroidobacteraceae bacterium]